MEWNVYRENINSGNIERFNVFRHGGLVEDIRKFVKKRMAKEVFTDELRKTLLYYFWSKSEYEVLICQWPINERDKPVKVDVYGQIMLNWPQFSEYVWEHRKEV